MQASQSSNTISHPLLTPADLNNPSCMMWGVLALVGLHEDAPPNGDTLDETAQAFMYRGAVNKVIKAFSPLLHDFGSAASQNELWERVAFVNMMVNSFRHYHVMAATPPDVVILPKYLTTLVIAFHRQLQINPVQAAQDPYSVIGMEKAVAELIRNVLHDAITGMLEVVYSQCDLAEPSTFEDEFRSTVCKVIEDFVEPKLDIPNFHGQVPADSIGQHMVELIQPALHDWVGEAVAELFEALGFGTENVLIDDSVEANTCLDNLYTKLGLFFSFRSILLENFLPEEDIPEHVATRDFARYEENDWFQREFELFDGTQDVLRGPMSATLDDVSIPVEADENFELKCGLCQETGKLMREVKVCGHEYCEVCLTEQLQVQHECRYKCALCRAEFFPQGSV
jgi:hypothetical protein